MCETEDKHKIMCSTNLFSFSQRTVFPFPKFCRSTEKFITMATLSEKPF